MHYTISRLFTLILRTENNIFRNKQVSRFNFETTDQNKNIWYQRQKNI